MKMKFSTDLCKYCFFFYCFFLLAFPGIFSDANQMEYLDRLIKSRRSKTPPRGDEWSTSTANTNLDINYLLAGRIGIHENGGSSSMQSDKIEALPGQPEGVDFDQYSGFVTVDPKAGRALFYYFVESPNNTSTKPLVLWLNGGPGCSSLGFGAMEELGPFRVNSDGKTLYRNNYAWNNVANVIFLESPAGVGFSYSNTSSDYNKSGDKRTAEDALAFLINWLDRYPHYKTRDFFITGESYGGHYVPQLAYAILLHNKNTNRTIINLKGIAIGNAWIDDETSIKGILDYFWTHALNSDETNAAIHKYCNFSSETSNSKQCDQALTQSGIEIGHIYAYNIYAPFCNDTSTGTSTAAGPNQKSGKTGSVDDFDPCSDNYVNSYLNLPEVQTALHAKATKWYSCSGLPWNDSPVTVLPIIKQLIAGGIRLWIYSGDTDGRVPVTSSRYSINTLKLAIKKAWRPWYSNNEVGGYVVLYEGLAFVTVRGSGHFVPSYQPERALTMISSFLQAKLPPSS